MLTDGSVFDSAKPLHLHVVSVSFFLQQPTSICAGFKLVYSCLLCLVLATKMATFSVRSTLKVLWLGKEQREFVNQKIKRVEKYKHLAFIINYLLNS